MTLEEVRKEMQNLEQIRDTMDPAGYEETMRMYEEMEQRLLAATPLRIPEVTCQGQWDHPSQLPLVPPSPDIAEWLVEVNNAEQGPYNKAKLGEMLRAREITRQSIVWKERMTDWAAIETVPELQGILAKLPPPRPGARAAAPAAETVQYVSSDMEARYQQAKALYNNKRRNEAVPLFQALANEGHVGAQCDIAGCYYNGWGVEQSYAQAAQWHRKAAEQGNAEAQFYLGNQYEDGLGVEQDFTFAAAWYQKAADQGNAEAQEALGRLNDIQQTTGTPTAGTVPTDISGKSFVMPIEDIFVIAGRGTMVTGKIEKGTIRFNDEVEIAGGTFPNKVVVAGIEMFNRRFNEASAGENVGILLRGISKKDIKPGQVLVK